LEATPAEVEAHATTLGEGGALTVYTSPFPPPEAGDAEIVVACDARGMIAALAYAPARQGVEIPDLEVTLGLHAVPVRRGVTRVAPGTLLPAPAPIAIATQSGGFAAAMGVSGLAWIEPSAAATLAGGAALETALGALRDQAGGRAAAAVATDGKTARAALV
jgi:gamma-glutamyltranspeptidase/glutathione hydrolase